MSDRTNEAVRLARRRARRLLKSWPDRAAMVADAEHVAWQMAVRAGAAALPRRIARYAVLTVLAKRHFRRTVRSLEDAAYLPAAPKREPFPLGATYRTGDDPARQAAFRIDFAAWMDSLPDKPRRVAALLAAGHSPAEIALLVGVSRGRVSQIRELLRQSWYDMTGDAGVL